MTTRSQITGAALDGSNPTTPFNWTSVSGTTTAVVSAKYELNPSSSGAGQFSEGSADLAVYGGCLVKIIQKMEWESKATPTVILYFLAVGTVGLQVGTAQKLKVQPLSTGTAVEAGSASSSGNHFLEIEFWFDGRGMPRLIRVYQDTMTYGGHLIECFSTNNTIVDQFFPTAGSYILGSVDAKQNARQIFDNIDFLMVPSDN